MRAEKLASGFVGPDVTGPAEDEPEPLSMGTLADIFREGLTPTEAETFEEARSARNQKAPQHPRMTRSCAARGRRSSDPGLASDDRRARPSNGPTDRNCNHRYGTAIVPGGIGRPNQRWLPRLGVRGTVVGKYYPLSGSCGATTVILPECRHGPTLRGRTRACAGCMPAHRSPRS